MCLPYQKRSPRPQLSTQKPGMAMHICNLSIWEVEARGSDIEGHAQLHSEFEASLSYMKLIDK